MAYTQQLTFIDNITKVMNSINKATANTEKTMQRMNDAIKKTQGVKPLDGVNQSLREAPPQVKRMQTQIDGLNSKLAETTNQSNKVRGGFGTMFGAMLTSQAVIGGITAIGSGLKSVFGDALGYTKSKNMLYAMVGNDDKATEVFDLIKQKSMNSTVGVSQLTSAYSTFMTATKDTGQLSNLTALTEKLATFDKSGQGFEGAVFSVKELLSGDYTSLAERFNISRTAIKDMGIADMFKEGDITGGMAMFEKLLDGMGMTDEAMSRMMDDPSIKWSRMTSNMGTAFSLAMEGVMASLSPLMDKFNDMANNGMLTQIAGGIATGFGYIVTLASSLIGAVEYIYNYFVNNWGSISPVIEQLGIVFGYVFDFISSIAGNVLEIAGNIFNLFTQNWTRIAPVVWGIGTVLGWVLGFASQVFGVIKLISDFFINNWSLIEPIVFGIGTVMAFLGAVALAGTIKSLVIATAQSVIYYGTLAIMKGMAVLAAGAEMLKTGATWGSVAAQYGLNTAMWACPIVWIIGAVIALIAIMFIWSDVAGVVGGIFMVLFTVIYNQVAFIWNVFASWAEFFVNLFIDPSYAVKKLFADLFNNVIDLMANALFGVETFAGDFMKLMNGAINSALSGINLLIGGFNNLFGTNFGQIKLLDTENIHSASDMLKGMKMELPKTDKNVWTAPKMQQKDYGDAYNTGFDATKNTVDALKNKLGGIFVPPSTPDIPETPPVPELPENFPGTQENPAFVNEVDISEESIKLMRDVADMRFTQNYITLTPNISMGGVTVNENADFEMLENAIANGLAEANETSASGRYV